MNGNFGQYINNCDNLDEQISVTDFIKTLKKVESSDTINGRDSTSSSSSTDKLAKLPEDGRKVDKKGSANDLLQNMRKRFVHRATEPIFHALPEAQERRVVSGRDGSSTSSTNFSLSREPQSVEGGCDDLLKMPSFDTSLDRKTDSEPTLSKTRNKYKNP
ncbi:hypothetical protein CAEBREN_31067 [Caenorhabditis brenneri]|uniref:Uncharacterized protein n=1 Tax=Caenorhabditis brenneri TaxID=135651 RepID=G0NYX0_CAEBE|nr:hypothetical protein CAEBREN_31067 [Caenorhabditis brenneri]